MIVVTGGADFIGSCLHAALTARGHETAIADRLGSAAKCHGIATCHPLAPEHSVAFLAGDGTTRIEAVHPLGTIGKTVASDAGRQLTPIEDGIRRCVQNHLRAPSPSL